MDFISFFAGIGAETLGLERAGHRCIAQVEIDEFCLAVLNKHWPGVPKWKDIKTVCQMLSCGPLDFPAKTSRSQAKVLAYPGSVPGSSGTSCAAFAWWDQTTFCWRTWQRCFIEGWARYLGPWPKAGMTRNGIAYQRACSVHHTHESGCSLWPTPAAMDAKMYPVMSRVNALRAGVKSHRNASGSHGGNSQLKDRVVAFPSGVPFAKQLPPLDAYGGMLNPMWEEWLQGIPMMWTVLEQSATPTLRKCTNTSDIYCND